MFNVRAEARTLQDRTLFGGRRRLSWEQGVEQKQACAGDDGGVGQVEVGPVVGEDVDFNEVDDRAVEDAVVDVAEGSGKNEGEGDGPEGEAVAEADHGNEDDQGCQKREADQGPADRVGRSGVGEEREGRALVGPMGDAQNAGYDRDGATHGDAERYQ